MTFLKRTGCIFLGVVLGQSVWATQLAPKQAAELKQFLQELRENPKQVMNQAPYKTVSAKAKKSLYHSVQDKFSVRLDKRFCKASKTQQGVEFCLGNEKGRASLQSDDLPQDLVDNPEHVLDNLELIDAYKEEDGSTLASQHLSTHPWSDDYWAIAKGVLAQRYLDTVIADHFTSIDEEYEQENGEPFMLDGEETSSANDWRYQKDVHHEYPVTEYLSEKTFNDFQSPVDGWTSWLSPSEKYDLLMGDTNFTLTKKMWAEGRLYYNGQFGSVQTWMGICHGWAPVAYMMQRPLHKVKTRAAAELSDFFEPLTVQRIKDQYAKLHGALYDETNESIILTFYPSDIKSLGSLLWAKNSTPTKFIGGRCNIKKPEQDVHGRVKAQQCFDNNPASWHVTAINQIGVSDRSFIIDATYDYEVWNQPVYSYDYVYFNPQTGEKYTSWKEARVKLLPPSVARLQDSLLKYKEQLASYNEKLKDLKKQNASKESLKKLETKMDRVKAKINQATIRYESKLSSLDQSYFKEDLFAAHRLPYQAELLDPKSKRSETFLKKYVVGVEMKARYVVETEPSDKDEEKDALTTAYYRYDLEVTEEGKIVGGEWYSSVHPDFMWTPYPANVVDWRRYTSNYRRTTFDNWRSFKQAPPRSWRRAAKRASSHKSSPLVRVVEQLIEWSRL